MDNLYKDWLCCMPNNVRPVLSTDTTECFYKSLEAAYTMAFAPMLVETRGVKANIYGVQEYFPIWSLEYSSLDYDTGLLWSCDVKTWLKLSQMADYANHCLSDYVDPNSDTGALLNTINIWKGLGDGLEPYTSIGDDNCPMNSQWLPQAIRLGTMYTSLSSLEGTSMQPWWSSPYSPTYFGDPSFDGLRYTVYNGPYLPSNINRQWYCASWRALCKLINTPSIAIGGSQQGWRWINPLYRSTNSVCFNLSSFQDQAVTNQFIPLSSFIDYFDSQVCGGNGIYQYTLPWSVCGLTIGDAVYSSDLAAGTRGSVYSNLPILEPLDGMRAFFGAQQTFAQTHSSVYDMAYKLPYSFLDKQQFGEWTNILSTGTDVEHWGGSNLTGRWPEYSFVAKPFRTAQNTLSEVCLQEDLRGNICTPPLRLVAENMFAHQWLWNSFLFGTNVDRQTNKLNYTYAWSPLRFTRDHYYRDYSFNVYGEAHLSSDNGTDWMMVIDQDWDTTSRSNYQWRPLEEFAVDEPVLAHLEPNTLKYIADNTYGENVIQGDPYPQGRSQIYCVFEIPLPLSVDGATAVFDATYLSSSGIPLSTWNEYVRITKSMFPRTREDKIYELLTELDSEYLDESTGYIPNAMRDLSSAEEELSGYEKQLADVSADTWNSTWYTVVEDLWPSNQFYFNYGISTTSAWNGTNPAPFDNYLSDFYGTYWFYNGYYNFPTQKVNGTFDDGYPGTSPWWNNLQLAVFGSLSTDIAYGQVWKDGEFQGEFQYYNSYQLNQMEATISNILVDLSANKSAALAGVGIDLQTIGTQWPPVDCFITTDPQTGTETSSYTVDYSAWKYAVMDINNELESQAMNWYDQTKHSLENAFLDYSHYTELSDKMQYIAGVSSILDPITLACWQQEYGIALPYEEDFWQSMVSQTQDYIDRLSSDIDWLSAEYDRKYQEIMDETFDDPLPTKSDLKKFLHYDITGRAMKLSTEWSTSMTMFAICPDTDSEPLSNYPQWDYKWLQMDYMCDYPTTRWPYVRDVPTKYMVGIKKTALEEVTVNGNTQLSNVTKGRTWVHSQPYSYGSSQFDSFRYDLMGYMEAGIAGNYFGLPSVRPNPRQLFGDEVQNPGRWTIHSVLSVDTGTYSEGIERVEDGFYNTSVRFMNNGQSEEWEARKIWIYCINGPTVYTDDCWYKHQKRWPWSSTVPWKFVEGQHVPEYYNRPPSADVDFSLPELSGRIEVNASQQVLGEFDTTYFMKNGSGF